MSTQCFILCVFLFSIAIVALYFWVDYVITINIDCNSTNTGLYSENAKTYYICSDGVKIEGFELTCETNN